MDAEWLAASLYVTLEGARNRLNESADQFTTFIDRWRLVVGPHSKLLDGNVTRLEDSRR
jgi:hypothetical protein